MSTYGVNKSFVLRGIEDVVFEERPVPESQWSPELCSVAKYLIRRIFGSWTWRRLG